MTTVSARNAGLRRLSTLTRWVAGGAVGVTAVFSVMAARATAGKAASPAPTLSPSAPNQVRTPTSAQPPVPANSGAAATGAASGDAGLSQDPSQPAPLAPPVQAPQSSQQTPVVVSGGS